MTHADQMEQVARSLVRIERLLLRLIKDDYVEGVPVITNLGLESRPALPRVKPPTQGIGVVGTDLTAFGNTSSPPVITDDMKLIAKLVFEPKVREYLAGLGNFTLNEQVQVARNQCEGFVLKHCGGANYRSLFDGDPAKRLRVLLEGVPK